MLILRTLALGTAHGFAIAQSIQRRSDDALLVEEGSLYPALYRLEERGWIAANWGLSENNRRARFYKLTAKGRTHLATETTRWEHLARAVSLVMRPVD
jgi:transcriptional regulator